MGRQKEKTSNALAKTVDAEGKVQYDAIARQGHGKDKVYIYSCINLGSIQFDLSLFLTSLSDFVLGCSYAIVSNMASLILIEAISPTEVKQ